MSIDENGYTFKVDLSGIDKNLKEIENISSIELLKVIKDCGYTCEAGPLENNIYFIELMKRANEDVKETTYIDRMRTEAYELGIKIERANEFIDKETREPNFLDDTQIQLLKRQIIAMKEYHDVLMARIIYERYDSIYEGKIIKCKDLCGCFELEIEWD